MGARTDFEIRREERGLVVIAITSWWGDEGAVGKAGGIARSLAFATTDAAIA